MRHIYLKFNESSCAAVPEERQVLGGLSVIDNLRAAGPNLSAQERDARVANAFAIFPELKALSGQHQMVAIAQALVSRRRVLSIDEMSLGLASVIIDRLIEVIRDLGIGILKIEQFTLLALDIADRCYVLPQRHLKFEGQPAELKADPSILERACLGSGP